MTDTISPKVLRQCLLDASAAAASKTLPLFRSALTVDNKLSTGFDPVTQADRDAETAIRAVISGYFPDHAITGEEHPDRNANNGSPYRWIIDPVDGTRAFMSGLPVWGTLIGLTKNGHALAGLMSQPFTGETFIAIDGGSDLIKDKVHTALKARRTTALDQAIMFTTTPQLFATRAQRAAFDAVESQVQLSRYGCDCYAYALLAAGHIDLVIEPRMNSYDIAALIPLIENAGGVVGTWGGSRAEDGGNIIAAATPQLRDAALEIMARHTTLD